MASKGTLEVTARGAFIYPRLAKPDVFISKKTGAKSDPKYKTKFRLIDADAQPMIAKIDAALQERFDAVKADAPPAKKEKVSKADVPYAKVFNDAGEWTGEWDFNFSQNATITARKTGEKIDMRPKFTDASGKPIKPLEFWSGTVGRIAYELYVWSNDKLEVGVSLKPKKLRLIEVKQGGDGPDPFGDAEEGFSGDEFGDDQDAGDEFDQKDGGSDDASALL